MCRQMHTLVAPLNTSEYQKVMKRIACLSTLRSNADSQSLSSGHLVEIYNTSRVLSRRHGVTGVFLVSDNYLLQVAEGESEHLSRMIYILNRNDNIIDTNVIANQTIERPVFPGWTIRVLDNMADNRQSFLGKIGLLLAKDIHLKSDLDALRLSYFFDLKDALSRANSKQSNAPTEAQQNQAEIDFEGKMLSLTQWPKPSQLRLTVETMNLCSQLVGKTTSYEALKTLGIFSSEQGLRDSLNRLNSFGTLNVSSSGTGIQDNSAPSNVTPLTKKIGNRGDRFSRVLRRFIETAAR